MQATPEAPEAQEEKRALHARRRAWCIEAVKTAYPEWSHEHIQEVLSEIDPNTGDGPSPLSKDAYAVLAALLDRAMP